MGTPAFSLEDWGLDSNLNVLIPVVSGLVGGIGASWLVRSGDTSGLVITRTRGRTAQIN
jgi:hypothetical protein